MQLVHKKMYACFLKDDLYLSLCLLNQERSVDSHVLVGSLPFKVYLGVRFIHGNELNQDFVRVLIGQKKKLVQIVEITKTYGSLGFLSNPDDDRAGDQLKARFRSEYYQLDLSRPSTSH